MLARRTLLLSPLALACAAAGRRPNVLLITASGWRGIATPWEGDPDLEAPHLDRLGKQAVVFTRAYAYPFNESQSQQREDSFTNAFKAAGYAVQSFGNLISFREEHPAQPFFFHAEIGKLSSFTMPDAKIHLRGNVPAAIESEARQALSGFYGQCSLRDDEIGRILATLDRLGLTDDTVVVFTSDQGMMLGSHGLDYDDEPYEESARIPLAIRYPRVLKPALRGLASEVDIFPTLFALCGIDPPERAKGRNLLGAEGEESVCSRGKLGQPDEWRVLVRGYDKIVATPKGQITHLFNLADDPFELTNLAHDSAQKLKLASLKAQLLAQMKKLGDGFDPSGLRIR